MAKNNSDYTKPRHNLYELIPEVYKSKTNKALFENSFNRFLTKTESQNIVGTIGSPSKSLDKQQRIQEESIHRQTYQLQPLAYSNVGTVDHIFSQKDIFRHLQNLGVDTSIESVAKWANTTQFNFAPPINYDKFANYLDYYWYQLDEDGAVINSIPQYITIESDVNFAKTQLRLKQKELESIVPLDIVSVIDTGTEIVAKIANDYTKYFPVGIGFDIIDSVSNDGLHIVTSATYNGTHTLIATETPLNPINIETGQINFTTLLTILDNTITLISTEGNDWKEGLWDDNEYYYNTPVPTEWILENFIPHSDNGRVYNTGWGDFVDELLTLNEPAQQWIDENFWVHRSELNPEDYAFAKQAKMPILEYSNSLVLNNFTFIQHNWLHRNTVNEEWIATTEQPTYSDMFLTTPNDPNSVVDFIQPNPEFLRLWCYQGQSVSVVPVPVSEFTPASTYEKILTSDTSSPIDPDLLLTSSDVNVIISPTKSITYREFLFPNNLPFRPLANSNDIAVYVDGKRVYGVFEEVTETLTHFVDVEVVNGVRFELIDHVEPIQETGVLSDDSIVTIKISPVAEEDLYKGAVFVRTEPSDILFNKAVSISYLNSPVTISTKPEQVYDDVTSVVSLVSFRKVEQVKQLGEPLYPLYDIFEVDGTPAYKVSPIFSYKENKAFDINYKINKRIETDIFANELVYVFDQHLLLEDNGQLYCYMDLDTIISENPQGLQTIWRTTLPSGNQYTPSLVDINKRKDGDQYVENGVVQTASVNDQNGDIELLKPFVFNPHHENRKYLSQPELRSHFASMLNSQELPYSFITENAAPRLNYLFDYGAGGLIKEYNSSYDRLISTLIAPISDPIGVIEFADDSYASAMVEVKEYFSKNIVSLSLNNDYVLDTTTALLNAFINDYQTNSNLNVIFGDSNVYNEQTQQGIKNFVATLPYLKLENSCVPYKLVDPKLNISEVRCHDEHIERTFLDQNTIKQLAKEIVTTEISSGRLRGWREGIPADGDNSSSPPITTYLDIPMDRLLTNDYWLESDGITMYKMVAIRQSYMPTISNYPEGTYWLDDSDLLYQLSLSSPIGWNLVSPNVPTPNEMEPVWVSVDLYDIMRDLVLRVEQKLYDNLESPVPVVWTADDYILDQADQAKFDQYMEEYFLEYAAERKIINPFSRSFDPSDPWTWNYKDVSVEIPNVFVPYFNAEVNWAASWNQIYTNMFGTPYPHLEPWILQGYNTKPTWWDEEYKGTTRRWSTTMWSNIKSGTIPLGRDLPPVSPIQVYTHVSVNTTDETTTDGYGPDDLFPPYWEPASDLVTSPINGADVAGKTEVFIRSYLPLVPVDLAEVFVFGEGSPIELAWKKSTSYQYDVLKASFRLQPIRFMHQTWGNDHYSVGLLHVDTYLKRVSSHANDVFHGDLVDNVTYISDGINQWYVNYNRYVGHDNKNSDFRTMWSDWITKFSYQIDAFVDPKSVSVKTPILNINKQDYDIVVKKSPGVVSDWVGALQLSLSSIGAYKPHKNFKTPKHDGYDWEFLVTPISPSPKFISCYDTRNVVVNVSHATQGLLTAVESIDYYETGDEVTVYTSDTLPVELRTNELYYIIKISEYNFKLAYTYEEALIGDYIPFTSFELGEMTLRQTISQFIAGSIDAVWSHNVLNKDNVVTYDMGPIKIRGIQNVIDFVDGYSAYMQDQGFIFNDSSLKDRDPTTDALVSWSYETIRFIEKVYSGFGLNNTPQRFVGHVNGYTVDTATNTIQLDASHLTPYSLAQEVFIFTSSIPPGGLSLNTPYYVIPLQAGKYRLATTALNANDGIYITLTTNGHGAQFIGIFPITTDERELVHEINPFRTNLWYRPESGVVSNLLTGPYSNYRTDQVLYDQYLQPLSSKQIRVFREDKMTHIMVNELPNNVSPQLTNNPYHKLHIGGVNIFVDEYEHVIMFKPYTTDDYLIYDSFLGLSQSFFYLNMERQSQKTNRPSVGGFFNYKDTLVPNLESGIENMQKYYDTYGVQESSQYLDYARDLLGFRNPEYMDLLGSTEKSKFIFWRGMIQHKGSTNAINAFINSRQFVDAKVDEYWAYKIGTFGDNREKTYHEMKLNVDDLWKQDARYELNVNQIVEKSFTGVAITDPARWVSHPDILTEFTLSSDISDSYEINVDNYNDYMFTYNNELYMILKNHCDNCTIYSQSAGYWTNDVDFVQMTSTLVKILNLSYYSFLDASPSGSIIVDLYNVAVNKLTPCSIIDGVTNTTLSKLSMWDPAKDVHNQKPLTEVNFITNNNPLYTAVASEESPSFTRYEKQDIGWGRDKVGKVWLNKSKLDYVPYHDIRRFPNVNDQLTRWGRLSDWADIELYEWVKSPVPPAEYDTFVASQEGNISIPVENRFSGTPKKTIFYTYPSSPEQIEVIPNDDFLQYHCYAVQRGVDGSPTFGVLPTLTDPLQKSIMEDGEVNVYVNGVYDQTTLWTSVDLRIYKDTDFISIICVTNTHPYLTTDYDYVVTTDVNVVGIEETSYYFWTRSSTLRPYSRSMSIQNAESLLKKPNDPFIIFRKPITMIAEDNALPSFKYTQFILRGISDLVTTNDRFKLQMTRDFTLRDDLDKGDSLKNVHTEWKLIRQDSTEHVPEELWNKLTESLVGYELEGFISDPQELISVPSETRRIYDETYDTTYQYGLRPGQTFINKEVGVDAVQKIIISKDFDVQPLDKNIFFENYSFDNSINILEAMEYIYANFPISSVNEIFFTMLHIALSENKQYPDIFKTSMIALHGIKTLETQGT